MTDATYAPVRDARGALAASSLQWLLDLLAGEEYPSEEEVQERFVPAFLDKHPEGVDAWLDSGRTLGPFEVVAGTPVAHKAWATLIGPGGKRYTLAMTVDTSGMIRRAEIETEVLARIPETFADLNALLDRPDVHSAVLVARRSGDDWQSLYERSADDLMPGGSVFKVYILLALAREIAAGTVDWEEELVVGPLQRSLPTGEMQDLPDGTRATVAQTAYNMFARSDNTASDLILERIGQDAIRRAVIASGHQDAAVLDPFVSSRELFEIGWGPEQLLAQWEAADSARRAELLTTISRPLTTRLADLKAPAYPRGLDWFMSPRDVANALKALRIEVDRDPTGRLREMVTIYPGIQMDTDAWPFVLFKGGSTPGVVMFCWLLENADGIEHVVVLQQRAERVGILQDGLPLRRLGDVIIHNLLA